MDRELKRKNGSYCRIRNVFGIIGVFAVVFISCAVLYTIWWQIDEKISSEPLAAWQAINGQLSSETIQDWIDKNGAALQGASRLGIVAPDTSEFIEINIADNNSKGINFERIIGDKLQVTGRKDADRGYFEGKVAWNGQEICILNFDTREYAVLREDIRSFMIGDYYVSCKCNMEQEEVELLIFYCPA